MRFPRPFSSLLLALLVLACTTATVTAAPPARLFAPDSVWNRRLPDAAPLDPTSPLRTGALLSEVRREIAAGTGPWLNDHDFSTPVYVVSARQRRVPVSLDTGSWGAPLKRVLAEGVPIPPRAVPALGTDRHMTVYQPATDTLWEFWHAQRKPDGWHANWGGAMRGVSRSPGHYTDASWPGLGRREGWNWGASATSLPVVAGTIMTEELRRGRIPHALAMSLPNACKGTFSWPAQRSDGWSTAPDCLPEGAQLRLDPQLDLDVLDLPPMTRMLAEAVQRYGAVVRDVTGRSVGFFAEDRTWTSVDPYRGPSGLFGGLRPWNFMPRFPWSHLQLLRMTRCAKAPCERRGPRRNARTGG